MVACLVRNISPRKSLMVYQEWARVLFLKIVHRLQRSQKEWSKIRIWKKLRIHKSMLWEEYIRQISLIHGMKLMRWDLVQHLSTAKSQWTSSNRKALRRQLLSHLICGKVHRTSKKLKTWEVAKKIWRTMMIWSVRYRRLILIGVRGKRLWKP